MSISHTYVIVRSFFYIYKSCPTGGLLSVTWSMEQLDRCGLPSWPKRALYRSTALTPAGTSAFLILSVSYVILQTCVVIFLSALLLRSMELVYQRPGVMKGIPLYRFVAPKTLFANGTDYAPNEGFCPCRQSGLLNVSSCRQSEYACTHMVWYTPLLLGHLVTFQISLMMVFV